MSNSFAVDVTVKSTNNSDSKVEFYYNIPNQDAYANGGYYEHKISSVKVELNPGESIVDKHIIHKYVYNELYKGAFFISLDINNAWRLPPSELKNENTFKNVVSNWVRNTVGVKKGENLSEMVGNIALNWILIPKYFKKSDGHIDTNFIDINMSKNGETEHSIVVNADYSIDIED